MNYFIQSTFRKGGAKVIYNFHSFNSTFLKVDNNMCDFSFSIWNKLLIKIRENGYPKAIYKFVVQDARLNDIYISITNNIYVNIQGTCGELDRIIICKCDIRENILTDKGLEEFIEYNRSDIHSCLYYYVNNDLYSSDGPVNCETENMLIDIIIKKINSSSFGVEVCKSNEINMDIGYKMATQEY